jgi:hypothetical protein
MIGNIHSYIEYNKKSLKTYPHLYGNSWFQVYDGKLGAYFSELSSDNKVWWNSLHHETYMK